ncbi:MAG: AMP-binding protein [Terriglobus roseus]|nr:AMP-binding protein [Terriglobus roseus]
MAMTPGKRIIVAELDRRAKLEPERVLAIYPKDNTLAEWQEVTFGDYAKAVDRMCAFLEPIIGRSTTFDTQALYGPPDMRYHFFLFACIKLGHKALFSAPRNSHVMQQHILKAGECKTIFHDAKLDMPALLGDTKGYTLHKIPTLQEMLWAGDEPRHYEYTKTFDEAKMDPYIVLHTSGSTGMPKPIIHRQGWASAVDKGYHHPGHNGIPSTTSLISTGSDNRLYAPFPPFHVSGAELIMVPQITREVVWIWGPTDRLPSVEDVKTCCKAGRATTIGMPTQLYKDFLNDKEGYEILKNMKCRGYGGGESAQSLAASQIGYANIATYRAHGPGGWRQALRLRPCA